MLQKNWFNSLNPTILKLIILYLHIIKFKPNFIYLNFYQVTLYINIVMIVKNKKLKKVTVNKKVKKKRYIFNLKYRLFTSNINIFNIVATNTLFRRKRKKKKILKTFNQKLNFVKLFLKRRGIVKLLIKGKRYSWFRSSFIKTPYKAFTMKQRQFIVKKVLVKRLFSFLVKHNPHVTTFLKYKFFRKRKVFLMNMHKKLAWKMHKARVIHWNFSTKGQLNKYRYNKLLASCMFFLKKNSAVTFLIFLLFAIYNYSSTWKQLLLIINKNLIVLNGSFIYKNATLKQGDILELPFGKCFALGLKTRNYKQHIKKLKNVTYRFFKKKKKQNKKIPKIYKKILFKTTIVKNFIAYDPTLNIVAIIDKVPKFNYNLKYELLKSSVIGLQNWRYEFQ